MPSKNVIFHPGLWRVGSYKAWTHDDVYNGIKQKQQSLIILIRSRIILLGCMGRVWEGQHNVEFQVVREHDCKKQAYVVHKRPQTCLSTTTYDFNLSTHSLPPFPTNTTNEYENYKNEHFRRDHLSDKNRNSQNRSLYRNLAESASFRIRGLMTTLTAGSQPPNCIKMQASIHS